LLQLKKRIQSRQASDSDSETDDELMDLNKQVLDKLDEENEEEEDTGPDHLQQFLVEYRLRKLEFESRLKQNNLTTTSTQRSKKKSTKNLLRSKTKMKALE